MRRSLVVSLALLAVVRSPAVAQTCLGLASYSTGPVQVTGNGQFTQGQNSFGGGIGYGLPSGAFGSANVSTTSFDALNASATGIGARIGYQMKVGGKLAQAQLCPTASIGLGMGPKNVGGTGDDMSSRSATVGFALGTSMGATPRMKFLPNAGLALAYGKSKTQNAAGTTTFEGSDTYGLATLGMGLVFNQNIAVRPSVDIPLGLTGSDPTFGVTVGFNFGRKH